MNLSKHLYKKIVICLLVVVFAVVATIIFIGKVRDYPPGDIINCDPDTVGAENTDSTIHITMGTCAIKEAWYELSNGKKCRASDLIGMPLFADVPNLDGKGKVDDKHAMENYDLGGKGQIDGEHVVDPHEHCSSDESSSVKSLSANSSNHAHSTNSTHTCTRRINGHLRKRHAFCPPHGH